VKKPRITNLHHHQYAVPEHGQPDWVSRIYKGEHLCISRLRLYTRKSVSRGLLKDLLLFALMNWDRATDLDALVEFARKEGA
jgi:hypothetical protein